MNNKKIRRYNSSGFIPFLVLVLLIVIIVIVIVFLRVYKTHRS